MKDPTKLEHFRNLISLSAADGQLHEIEKATLSKIAFERGIPLERLNIMFKHAAEYKFIVPQNQKDRHKQLEEMIDFAMIDGDFAKAELDLILHISEKLGFSREEAEEIINTHRQK